MYNIHNSDSRHPLLALRSADTLPPNQHFSTALRASTIPPANGSMSVYQSCRDSTRTNRSGQPFTYGRYATCLAATASTGCRLEGSYLAGIPYASAVGSSQYKAAI
ncbi:uncharacterized protein SETTUDRAFT_31669 [Exserohilum turcica Et28A]|uniref:Uncharacterized protein n=1 Tax=Exserohilum turcicum (strain 28A) TaxID=671987 RepID=R0KDF4_EXST2|nr:uncharacterized protein SETTUDRAFT_31669 [Exserohilum turcica Et28A]EOA87404.1 hypothetical protein SETTUDRAFT_31669 [Exserohilum turcica Et28A]